MVFPHNRSTVDDDIVREIDSCRIVEEEALTRDAAEGASDWIRGNTAAADFEGRTKGLAVQVRPRARELKGAGVASGATNTVRRIPCILARCVLDALAEEEWIGDARRPASNRMAIGIQYRHSAN